MSEAPKRRWFRFSLRTLFVMLAVVGTLFGWRRHTLLVVEQRRELLAWVELHGGSYKQQLSKGRVRAPGPYHTTSHPTPTRNPLTGVPLIWPPYGDGRVLYIEIPGVWRHETEVRQIEQAFPEAKVTIGLDR